MYTSILECYCTRFREKLGLKMQLVNKHFGHRLLFLSKKRADLFGRLRIYIKKSTVTKDHQSCVPQDQTFDVVQKSYG